MNALWFSVFSSAFPKLKSLPLSDTHVCPEKNLRSEIGSFVSSAAPLHRYSVINKQTSPHMSFSASILVFLSASGSRVFQGFDTLVRSVVDYTRVIRKHNVGTINK